MAYKASQIEIEHKEYDPYAILGLDRVNLEESNQTNQTNQTTNLHNRFLFKSHLKEASEKEIKKQYRELSKTMHPDKGGDEEKFKQLAKAYQALTDEETRKNWQEYGNPDGPGGIIFQIKNIFFSDYAKS